MIEFNNKYPYKKFYRNLTRFGDYKEAEIETAYNNSYIAASGGLLEVIKAKNTDGIISYIDENGNEFLWIQETKNGKYFKSSSDLNLARQLGQAIYYYFYNWKFKYNNRNIRGIIINTEFYYGYVKISDIQDFLDELEPMYRITTVKSACHIKEDNQIISKIRYAINNNINLHLSSLKTEDELTDYYKKALN